MRLSASKTRTWRCYPAPISSWQKVLGWFLAVITVFEAAVAAKVFRLPHPILIGMLVASSVPAIFPLRAIRRAPRLSLTDGELVFSAPWTERASSDMPTRIALDRIDLASVAVVIPEQRTDLAIADLSPSGSHAGETESGWRKLANGRMAHVSLSPGRPAVYVPVDGDRAFLLALRQPEELLEALRDRSRRAA